MMPIAPSHGHNHIQVKQPLRSPISFSFVLCTALFLSGCRAATNISTATIPAGPHASVTVENSVTATDAPAPTETPTALNPTDMPAPSATPSATESRAPSPTKGLAAGATQVWQQDGMRLVYVPAGEFILGSRPEDVGADEDEFPQRTISLDAFWIDQTEVTNAMYAAFLNATGGHATGGPAWLNSVKETVQIIEIEGQWQPLEGLAQHPVVEVTWYGAEAYCTWAGRRLPSEAEWEKAARGTDGRVYPWGEAIDCSKALYGNCPEAYTFPVGSLPAGASPYGALDMAGNVWEWVADWYAVDSYAKMPNWNPAGPENGTARVVRGGSFDYNAKHNRPADRRNDGPENSSYDYGFRCALSEKPSTPSGTTP